MPIAKVSHQIVGVIQGDPGQLGESLLEGVGEAVVRLECCGKQPAAVCGLIQSGFDLEVDAGKGCCLEIPVEAAAIVRYRVMLRLGLLKPSGRRFLTRQALIPIGDGLR